MNSNLDKTFEALASLPRRKIMALLSHVELTTSELAEKLAISAPATWKTPAWYQASGAGNSSTTRWTATAW